MTQAQRKTLTIYRFLTDAQIRKALALYNDKKAKDAFAKRCCAQVIEPNLDDINSKLGGKQHDPMYLAYMVENVFNQAR